MSIAGISSILRSKDVAFVMGLNEFAPVGGRPGREWSVVHCIEECVHAGDPVTIRCRARGGCDPRCRPHPRLVGGLPHPRAAGTLRPGSPVQDRAHIPIDVGRFIAPAVVVDASAGVAVDEDWLLTVDFLRAWEERHGRIPAGAWLAFRTDWSKRIADPESFVNMKDDGAHTPGPTQETVEWLIRERDVLGFAAETINTDAGPSWCWPLSPGSRFCYCPALDRPLQVGRARAHPSDPAARHRKGLSCNPRSMAACFPAR